MQKVYEKLNKIISLICFVFIFFTGFYGVIWLYCAVNLPSSWIYNSPINYFPGIIQNVLKPYIYFGGRQVDMSFLIVAFFFFIFYLVAMYLITWSDNQAYKCELGYIEERKRIEKLVNEELKEENKRALLEYNSSIVLIKFIFSYIVDQNVIENLVKISDIEERSYNRLLSDLNLPYSVKKGKFEGSAYFILGKFWHIEHFISEMLKVMKEIYQENLKDEVKTNFTFCADVLKSEDNFSKELQGLSRITSFEYKNKIIATLSFVRRYELKENKVFEFYTIGTSRYFEKVEGENKSNEFKTQDFELYYIKSRNRKF